MEEAPLIDRVRAALEPVGVTEKKMFGGVCFMLNGNMLVGASPRGLLVRVGKEGSERALERPHAALMEQRGRAMPGYIVVANEGAARQKGSRGLARRRGGPCWHAAAESRKGAGRKARRPQAPREVTAAERHRRGMPWDRKAVTRW